MDSRWSERPRRSVQHTKRRKDGRRARRSSYDASQNLKEEVWENSRIWKFRRKFIECSTANKTTSECRLNRLHAADVVRSLLKFDKATAYHPDGIRKESQGVSFEISSPCVIDLDSPGHLRDVQQNIETGLEESAIESS